MAMGTASTDIDAVRRELTDRGYATVTVSGGCMEPAFHDGQWVVAHREREPRRSSVALLDCGGTLEIHRLGFHVRRGCLRRAPGRPGERSDEEREEQKDAPHVEGQGIESKPR